MLNLYCLVILLSIRRPVFPKQFAGNRELITNPEHDGDKESEKNWREYLPDPFQKSNGQ